MSIEGLVRSRSRLGADVRVSRAIEQGQRAEAGPGAVLSVWSMTNNRREAAGRPRSEYGSV
jgi:hypothetical protein